MGHSLNADLLKIKQLLYLTEAVRHGSISKASEANGIKQPNFSKVITTLENEIGEKLINRFSKGVSLTESGHLYYKIGSEIKNFLQSTDNVHDTESKISGSIRLWTSDGLGIGILSKCFAQFYQCYPKINIEITCSLNMPMIEAFDMAIVFQKPKTKSLHIKDEYLLKFGLFASKEYLERYGFPKNTQDLIINHKICDRTNYRFASKTWYDIVTKATSVTSSTNSSAMLLRLIKDGIGVGLLPVSTASMEENLVQINNIPVNLSYKCWLVLRKDAENKEKIQALTDIIDRETLKL